jgi:DNA-binding PadR family transcriptional regulator
VSLRYAILGLLTEEELSGYEITRRFERSVGYFWHARPQQIYPELGRLEEGELIAGRAVTQTGRPDKRVYRITELGLAELKEWAVSPSPESFVKDEFMVKVWCYGQVDTDAARSALSVHRGRHEERLTSYRDIRATLGAVDAGVAPSELVGALLTLEAGIAMENAFVEWCREAERVLERRAASGR